VRWISSNNIKEYYEGWLTKEFFNEFELKEPHIWLTEEDIRDTKKFFDSLETSVVEMIKLKDGNKASYLIVTRSPEDNECYGIIRVPEKFFEWIIPSIQRKLEML